MADFLSQTRIHGYRFCTPEIATPVTTTLELNRTVEQKIFKNPRVSAHDCRPENLKDHVDPKHWEAYILSAGIKKTYDSVSSLHHKEKVENDDGVKTPDKLLFNSGERGSGDGMFNFPRGVAVAPNGDIVVADTFNHRVQIFNRCALLKFTFGNKGNGNDDFNQPSDVAVMPNGRIVVADKKNKRVQVFSEEGQFKYNFHTKDQPCYITCDRLYNIIVSTTKRTVEVYRRQGALRQSFPLSKPGSNLLGQIVANRQEQIVVCDSADEDVKIYTYTGDLVRQFTPVNKSDSLACQATWVDVNHLDQIILVDSLNSCVNLYNEEGQLVRQIVNPSDDVGPVHTCAVGPEGHLVITEFSANGKHCLKVFRYRECKCHKTRPGSSKRPSRASSPADELKRKSASSK